ncbi:MAG TPA: methyltransferase domain-containing protein [Xanthobacteraceae bacterium]
MKENARIASSQTDSIDSALSRVEAAVRDDKSEWDIQYFIEHRLRYSRTIQRVTELCPTGGRILNIGSHFLHLSAALHLLGYETAGIDVAAFSEQPLIKQRAARFHVTNNVVDRIDDGTFLAGGDDTFELVLFTEIMEHITFNPIRFWQRVYALMKPGSVIYITTPNSLTPWKMLHAFKNIVTMRGIGISMPEILHTVTYGHHWKEYSGKEIREYFALMSSDFHVEIRNFNLPMAPLPVSLKGVIRQAVHWAGSFVPSFRDQIDVVVRLKSKSLWRIQPPEFI